MYLFILAGSAMVLAAVLWYAAAAYGASGKTAPQPPETGWEQRLRQTLAEDTRLVEALTGAIRDLETVMAHPSLGGPGFLMIQLPPAAEAAVVTAQYPNIREELYRRIVRQELGDLAAAGIPEELLVQEAVFETESGGVVLISVQAGGIPIELREHLNSRRERNTVLTALAELLGERLPNLSVRIFGADLLLSPVQEKEETVPFTATSTDE